MVTVPFSFQYDLGNQHGIPSRGKDIRQIKLKEEEEKRSEGGTSVTTATNKANVKGKGGGKQKIKADEPESKLIHDWIKGASGQSAEQLVYNMLQQRFSKESCLLVNGFKGNDLLKVIKENIDAEKGLKRNVDKRNEIRTYSSIFRHVRLKFFGLFNTLFGHNDEMEKEKNVLENEFTERELQFKKLTHAHYCDLEEQILKMMDSIKEETFSEVNKHLLLDKIRGENGPKPGYDLLSEKNKKTYMKDVEDLLKKKFKERAVRSKSQLKDFILEHFLELTDPNAEFDLLLFLKVRY